MGEIGTRTRGYPNAYFLVRSYVPGDRRLVIIEADQVRDEIVIHVQAFSWQFRCFSAIYQRFLTIFVSVFGRDRKSAEDGSVQVLVRAFCELLNHGGCERSEHPLGIGWLRAVRRSSSPRYPHPGGSLMPCSSLSLGAFPYRVLDTGPRLTSWVHPDYR